MAAEASEGGEPGSERVQIDTSAPFESVKEAANLFGGMGFWKPSSRDHASQDLENINLAKAQKQAEQLERDLIIKERETLDVLKELETTRIIVEELKFELHKEASETNALVKENSWNPINAHSAAENENQESNMNSSDAPGITLLELEQAKMNLARTTADLVDIRATAGLYNKKIEKERMLLDKTRERLSSKTSNMSSLEEELDQTKQALELTKHTELVQGSSPTHLDLVTRELQKLSSETEQFKEVGRSARSQVLRTLSQIEHTRNGIKTAEIRLVAAKKMKKAARASEAVALAEIRALSSGENKSNASEHKCESVTLTLEEYSSLISRAIESNEAHKDRAVHADLSKTDILNRVEKVTEELKICKETLEEALSRVEAANRSKLAVEKALHKWRSEHSQKQCSVHNSTKFKNSCRFLHFKESHMLDENVKNHGTDELKPVLKRSLSIGQILSRKVLLSKEYENGMQGERSIKNRQVSLRHFLSKHEYNPLSHAKRDGTENPDFRSPRKKLSFSRISVLVRKQMKNNKKKKQSSLNQNVSQLER